MCKVINLSEIQRDKFNEEYPVGKSELQREELQCEFKDEIFQDIEVGMNMIYTATNILKENLGARKYRKYSASAEGAIIDEIATSIDILYKYYEIKDRIDNNYNE